MADGTETEAGGGAAVETARGGGERRQLSRRAEALARRAAESKATIPHIYLGRSVPVPGLAVDRLGPAVVAAVGSVLAEERSLNAAYRDGAVELRSRVNVGFVFELGEEAAIATIFDADERDEATIAAELARLEQRAREGALTSPELAGGTFTVSLAPAGADWVAAPVTPGQSAHLAVGRPRDDRVELTLSCDQRAVRAPAGARFLELLAARLGERAAPPPG